MQAEGWPAISSERFEWESPEAHKRRLARIAEIMTGFRMGRYASDVADRMDEELISLQELGFYGSDQRLVARASASKYPEARLRQLA